ncbi:hypothetical protein NQ314_020233 [Rhamnusium bicolor]|uniref:Geminin n=1 Tax=Rhamnusium bicolor TaxID=1586634 RepID=A0AAV8WLI5_9CUCU|nr:hypothetical protein NQ314_020233 [Rhamnusium bicolor]
MMKTEKKVIIKVESQDKQENAKTTRRTLKVLQRAATDKENLVGRPQTFKDAKAASDFEKSEAKRKKPLMQNKSVQTGECIITAEDLTSDEPSADYWRRLAETRGESLNKSFKEIEDLKSNIEVLQEENKICKELLDESKNLVEVLQEMLNEKDDDDDVDEQAAEGSSD